MSFILIKFQRLVVPFLFTNGCRRLAMTRWHLVSRWKQKHGINSRSSTAHLIQSKERGHKHVLPSKLIRKLVQWWSTHMKHDHSENTDAESSEGLMAHGCNAEGFSESGTSSTPRTTLFWCTDMEPHWPIIWSMCSQGVGNNKERVQALEHPSIQDTEKYTRRRTWPELENFRQQPVTGVTTQSPDDRQRGTWIPYSIGARLWDNVQC